MPQGDLHKALNMCHLAGTVGLQEILRPDFQGGVQFLEVGDDFVGGGAGSEDVHEADDE